MSNPTEQIKEKIDIVEFVGQYVPLKKSGRSFVGFCPFHSNTRTPAFTVYPDTQSFHCFGCKASGTVFDFLMRREGLEFKDALERLAVRAGVELAPRTDADEQLDAQRTRLLAINADATRFFQHMLVKSPRGEQARDYVNTRGIDAATVETFALGFAPDDWTALTSYLTDRKGHDPADIVAAGLARKRDEGGYFDMFRNRLVFPIRSAKGEVIAFGGRAFGDAQPKYLNSPQTPLFDKSKTLYAFDLARDNIRGSEAAVIVEGYVDVVIAHQHGFRNVVAPLGTALTGEHVQLLKRLAKTVYLALDADAAGVRATLKGLHTLEEHLDRELRPIVTPQGIVRWEKDLSAGIKVVVLPDGQDPDEFIRADPAGWQRAITQALPVMEFYIGALTADLDLSAAKGKAEAVRRLAPLAAQVADTTERAFYIDKIAQKIGVDRQVILGQMRTAANPEQIPGVSNLPVERHRPPRRDQGGLGTISLPVAAAVSQAPDNEDHLLSLLLRHPTAQTAVVEKLRADLADFPVVRELISGEIVDLLARVEARAVWQSWSAQPATTEPQPWAEALAEPLRSHALRALALESPQPQSYRFVIDALECATILQREQARRWLTQIATDAATADTDDTRLAAFDRHVQLVSYIDALNIPKRSATFNDIRTTVRSA